VPPTGRHVAQRDRARSRALLPALLLTAYGGAFAGLAVLPIAPDAAAAAPDGSGVEQSRWSADGAAAGRLLEERDAALAARGALRASRDRTGSRSLDREQPRRPATARPAPSPSAAPTPVARPEFVRPGVGPLTSRFGSRWGRLHAGIDLASGTGAPVSAAAEGTVLSAGTEGGYGQVVRMQHADDTVTVYAHLSALVVRPGQRVAAGTVVGREGSTGHSTGPHLHFEVRIAGVPVDPLPWLQARGVAP
jgi:murein DD-endopeptidase MepM/ murein hydrolase activator NlpD